MLNPAARPWRLDSNACCHTPYNAAGLHFLACAVCRVVPFCRPEWTIPDTSAAIQIPDGRDLRRVRNMASPWCFLARFADRTFLVGALVPLAGYSSFFRSFGCG